jgi:dienelactone hydrolase
MGSLAGKEDEMTVDRLREEISEFLGFSIPETPVPFVTHDSVEEHDYRRLRICYPSPEGDLIPAFLLLPSGDGPFAAVLVHHQHHGQRHLGKSEVCGLVGDSLQAFGPALVRQGIVVLAPDSICFEDRRSNRTGIEADEDADIEQHYNEMCYRLLRGDTLMRKVLSDSAQGISLLREHPQIDPERVGIMGHSYGGNTVLFHGALDERIHFACSSGAACTYQYKMTHQLGIEMAEVIPGFATRYDISDLVTCFAPRRVLLVSATGDRLSQDAGNIVRTAQETCAAIGMVEQIEHQRYEGDHSLTQERFDDIVNWLVSCTG